VWPLTLRAQQSKSKPMRRVAALMPYSANDPQGQNRNAAFLQALQQLGSGLHPSMSELVRMP